MKNNKKYGNEVWTKKNNKIWFWDEKNNKIWCKEIEKYKNEKNKRNKNFFSKFFSFIWK